MHATDHEVRAAAKRFGLTTNAVRYRISVWGRERALTTPRSQGRPTPLPPTRTTHRAPSAEAMQDEVMGRVLDALTGGKRGNAAQLARSLRITRKRVLRALRVLVREGRLARKPAPDHGPRLRARWVYTVAA